MGDGWFHTGDIAQINDDGSVSIIDRKKNIFKLAQGEYVAAEYLESVYLKAPLVAQIFVYGDSFKTTLVAIVVPDEPVVAQWAKDNGLSGDFAQLCQEEKLKEAILAQLKQEATKENLKGFEEIHHVHLHHELFSPENNILTPTFKLKRNVAKEIFAKEIDAMYS